MRLLNESGFPCSCSTRREHVRARASLRVVDGLLVRVLAVGELERAVEDRHERLREALAPREPAGDGAVVRGGARERTRRERAARLDRDVVAVSQLAEHGLVVVRAADRDHVRVVLGGRAQQRRAADVDLLDRLVPLDVEPADRLLERDRG